MGVLADGERHLGFARIARSGAERQPAVGRRGPCFGGGNREGQRRAILVGEAELVDLERGGGDFQPFEVLGHGDGVAFFDPAVTTKAPVRTAPVVFGAIVSSTSSSPALPEVFEGVIHGCPRRVDRPVAVRGDIDRGFLARFQQAGPDDGEFARGDHQGVDFEFLGDSDRSPRTAALEYDIAFAVFARVVFVDRKEDARTAAVSLRVGRMYPLLDVGRLPRMVRPRGRN